MAPQEQASPPGGSDGIPEPPTLVLAGWLGSGPDHWQSHWLRQNPHWRPVEFGSWEWPDPAGWRRALAEAIDRCGEPPLLIAHSLGCLAAASLMAAADAPAIAAALLVAPPDPGRPDAPEPLRPFHPVARSPFGAPGLVVVSGDDPYAAESFGLELARAWGLEALRLGQHGHINAESGLGAWPEGLALAACLRRRLGS